MLTILDRGRHIPTARMLYTKAFVERQKEMSHWKWTPEQWDIAIKAAEEELKIVLDKGGKK